MAIWPGELDPYLAPELGRSVPLVIDAQGDFVDGDARAIRGTNQIVPAIAEPRRVYRPARLPIIHVVRLYDGADVGLARRTLIAAGAPSVRPGSPGSRAASGA